MDFMSDELFDGRRIRMLTIVDHFTRESLAIEVDGSLGGQRVVEALARLALGGRKPKTISIDNGPEFTSKRLDQWAYLNGVELGACPRIRSWRRKPPRNNLLTAIWTLPWSN